MLLVAVIYSIQRPGQLHQRRIGLAGIIHGEIKIGRRHITRQIGRVKGGYFRSLSEIITLVSTGGRMNG